MLIALVNTKGGVGKSTIAVHTAWWLRAQGLRVALFDADEQGSASRWLAQADPEIEILRMQSSPQILKDGPRLATAYDAIVADAPAALDARAAALTSIADLAVLPILPSALDIWASYRTARLIYRVQFHPKRRGLPHALTVLNRVQSRTRLARVAADAVRKYGFPVSPVVLEARQAYVEACARGTVVWRMGTACAAASDELTRLMAVMLTQMTEDETAQRLLARVSSTIAAATVVAQTVAPAATVLPAASTVERAVPSGMPGSVVAQRSLSADQVPTAPPVVSTPAGRSAAPR